MRKKIGEILWIMFLIAAASFYFFVAYEILDYFNIGVDGS